MFGIKKTMTKILMNQEHILNSIDEIEKDSENRAILLNKINDQMQNMLLSQNAKSESKGIFGLKKRK
jgi:hypothetical protein|tara:strand:- start:727 stop:927 length:201 start_codon:yes stop_codon:yes gene_type:complete